MTARVLEGRPTPSSDRVGASFRALLRMVPVRNNAAETAPIDNGVRISVDLVKPWYLFPPVSWFIRMAPRKSFRLEGVGFKVWELCDGRDMERLIETFASRYSLTFHEARVAVSSYVADLARRGIVSMMVKVSAGSA